MLFPISCFTAASNREATLAVLACLKTFLKQGGDHTILIHVVQYLLVPIPYVVAKLGTCRGKGNGKCKGPTSIAVWRRGLFAADLRRHTPLVFSWQTLGRPAKTRRVARHAAVAAWRRDHGRVGLRMASVQTAAVDDVGRICAVDGAELLRRSPGGATEAFAMDTAAFDPRMHTITGLAVAGGDWFLADHCHDRIIRLQEQSGAVQIVAGGKGRGTGAGQLAWPEGVAIDGSGNLLIVDSPSAGEGRLLKYTSRGSESVLATGLDAPLAVAADRDIVFVAEGAKRRILGISSHAFVKI